MDTAWLLMRCAGQSGGHRGFPAGCLDQTGWNRFIKWPGWHAVWDHCWWSIWQTVIFLCVCPAAAQAHTCIDTYTDTAMALQMDRLLSPCYTGQVQICSAVLYIKWKIEMLGAEMAWHENEEGVIRTDISNCELVCAITLWTMKLTHWRR